MHGFIDKNSPKSGPPCGMSGKREAMGLGEVVRGDGNNYGHVPTPFSGQ